MGYTRYRHATRDGASPDVKRSSSAARIPALLHPNYLPPPLSFRHSTRPRDAAVLHDRAPAAHPNPVRRMSDRSIYIYIYIYADTRDSSISFWRSPCRASDVFTARRIRRRIRLRTCSLHLRAWVVGTGSEDRNTRRPALFPCQARAGLRICAPGLTGSGACGCSDARDRRSLARGDAAGLVRRLSECESGWTLRARMQARGTHRRLI